jgi:hypothetical protein
MMGRIQTRAVKIQGGQTAKLKTAQTTTSPLTPAPSNAQDLVVTQPEVASPDVIMQEGEAMVCPA